MGSERDRAIAEAVRDAAWQAAYEAKGEPACAPVLRLDLDAIIAAVTAPAPDLPREVAMRIADAVRFLGLEQMHSPPSDDDLAAIVSRHLPTDEEREAADAVVEAAVAFHGAKGATPGYLGELISDEYAAVRRLLAIRAKRGAR